MQATTRIRTATRAVAATALSSILWLAASTTGAEAAETRVPPSQPRTPGSAAAAALAAEQARVKSGQPAPTPAAPSSPARPAPSGAAPTPPATATAAPVTGDVGATGAGVQKIEERLNALHYAVGPVDGNYDEDTAHGVTAFQKVHGMPRTGAVTPEVWSRMATAQDPKPLVPDGGPRRVEIDLGRQVLFLYEGNKLSRIITVSTGSGVPYCENGNCGDAVTPTGDFEIYRQGSDWEYGPLGGLYNPGYFVGGVAIHGSLSVPPEPVSHGCVRIPMSVAEWFPGKATVGTPVYVR